MMRKRRIELRRSSRVYSNRIRSTAEFSEIDYRRGAGDTVSTRRYAVDWFARA